MLQSLTHNAASFGEMVPLNQCDGSSPRIFDVVKEHSRRVLVAFLSGQIL